MKIYENGDPSIEHIEHWDIVGWIYMVIYRGIPTNKNWYIMGYTPKHCSGNHGHGSDREITYFHGFTDHVPKIWTPRNHRGCRGIYTYLRSFGECFNIWGMGLFLNHWVGRKWKFAGNHCSLQKYTVVSCRFSIHPSLGLNRSKNNANVWISRGPPFLNKTTSSHIPLWNASTSGQGSRLCPHPWLWKSCCILFSAPCQFNMTPKTGSLIWSHTISLRETTLQNPVSKVPGWIWAWFYIKSRVNKSPR